MELVRYFGCHNHSPHRSTKVIGLMLLRRLALLALLSASVIALTLLLVRSLGWRQHAITLADWLTDMDGNPCDRPCVLGIRPGITAFDEALRILEQHPLTQNLTQYFSNRLEVLFLGEDMRVGVVEDTDGLVYSIHIEPQRRDISRLPPGSPTLRLTLGELIAVLGPPNAFQLRETRAGPVHVATYFNHNLVIVNYRRTGAVSMYDPFVYIFMYRSDAASVYRPDVEALWRGFATTRMYFNGD